MNRLRGKAAIAVAGLLAMGWAGIARGGMTVYEDGHKKIEIGGRIQLMYVQFSADCPSGTDCLLADSDVLPDDDYDDLFFRRLRPYISGTITENWMGKIEFEFGESTDADEVQIKDAFIVKSGFANPKSKLTVGNAKSVFSREFVNSSASLQLVERGFTGDHNFGVPDRAIGVVWESQLADGRVGYALNGGIQNHDPAIHRMDFDSPANDAADWNEGPVVAGRVDFFPLGFMKTSQGDFERGTSKIAVGLGAFAWSNDDDRNSYTDAMGVTTSLTKVDLDSADGVELSVAYRGAGISADAEIQRVSGETVDETFTGGMYRDGSTDLDKFSVVAGYMLPGSKVEFAAGFDSQDADNYEEKWERTTVGVNWYVNGQNMKVQLSYRMVSNFLGLPDQDHDVIFATNHFIF